MSRPGEFTALPDLGAALQGVERQGLTIGNKDGTPMFFAGLWMHWKGEAVEMDTCTTLTMAANSFMEQIHKRMPVILQAEQYET